MAKNNNVNNVKNKPAQANEAEFAEELAANNAANAAKRAAQNGAAENANR